FRLFFSKIVSNIKRRKNDFLGTMHRYIEKVIGLDLVAKTPLGKAKAFIKFRTILRREIINAILIIIGVFSASFGLESFMLPNNFIDGGITGVSLLVRALSNWNLSLLI